MLVKWHTKPHAAKRFAKHPRRFHGYEGSLPARLNFLSTHTPHAPSVASSMVYALLTSLDLFPASLKSLQGALQDASSSNFAKPTTKQ
jgi:hypothetical protein